MLKNSLTGLYNFFFNYPTPSNLTNVWNFGVLSFIFLIIQILSGLILSTYYVPNEEFAFIFTEYLMRDTYFGWYVRYIHSNGASFFFFCVYLHFFRSLYYFSYVQPKVFIWNTGVLVLALMIVTAFTGYVLPWGQMSFWAATVITNLASVLPIFGFDTVITIWGSYGVSTVTLNRFYTFHFIMPFVILTIVIFHFIYLHRIGSSNNAKIINKSDKLLFHPYYTIKDLIVVILVFVIYFTIIYFVPNSLSHPDNYIMADPLTTPAHIVPEWYFLAFYAMLRSIPSKLGGVMTMAFSIIILFIFPTFVRSFYQKSMWKELRFNYSDPKSFKLYIFITKRTLPTLQKYLFWFFVIDFIGLSYIGMQPAEEPYLLIGLILTSFYFIYFWSSLYIQSFFFWLEFMYELEKKEKLIEPFIKLYKIIKSRIIKYYIEIKKK